MEKINENIVGKIETRWCVIFIRKDYPEESMKLARLVLDQIHKRLVAVGVVGEKQE